MDLQTLNRYHEEGWLMKQVHPDLPLTIWNYTAATQYEQRWDEVTLRCRGLVTDDNGVIVNNPIPKFFNYSESRGKYVCNFKKPFKVFEKYDGSMIQVFWYEDNVIVASRGSFTSQHALWAAELLNNKPVEAIQKGYTYIFELIHPENRIVVNYGDTKDLILLSIRDVEGDIWLSNVENYFTVLNEYKIANLTRWKHLKNLAKMNDSNREGYVILFASGERVKVKFEEYVELHKIYTGLTNKHVWEAVRYKRYDELIDKLPDEMYQAVSDLYHEMYNAKKKIKRDAGVDFLNRPNHADRKEFAEWAKKQRHPSIMFALYDADFDLVNDIAWVKVKPAQSKLVI
jgi:RNA ligase